MGGVGKNLLAYMMDCFEQLEINIVTAKIHSNKTILLVNQIKIFRDKKGVSQ